jgi:REP element-mobilizing transposase RayT
MSESQYIHKSHNVSVIIYHYVCPAKYRKVIFSPEVDDTIKETCLEISKRYQVHFLEIGTDNDHVHFPVQAVPVYVRLQMVLDKSGLKLRDGFSTQ